MIVSPKAANTAFENMSHTDPARNEGNWILRSGRIRKRAEGGSCGNQEERQDGGGLDQR